MNCFEEIVPSLEICKLIPNGEFDGSVFVWVHEPPFGRVGVGENVPLPRCTAIVEAIIAPAPTLQEIMTRMDYNLYTATAVIHNYIPSRLTCMDDNLDEIAEEDENPSNAALRLWLRILEATYGR